MYFVRSDDAPGLWSMPIGGGPESRAIPDVRQNLWAVTDTGIAFIVGHLDEAPVIRWFSFATGATSDLATLPTGYTSTGFSMSRDARSALFARLDEERNDLMLIDPWHP